MALTTAPVELVSLDGTVTINDSSADVDFRVESNGNTHMLFIDAGNDHVNIGTSADLGGVFNVFGTGAGNARVVIEGESGADPSVNFLANNTTHFTIGIDDSEADTFKISQHSALGTNDFFQIRTNGGVGIGVTPTDGMDANIEYLQIGEQSIFRAGDTDYTDATVVATNLYQTGGTDKYIVAGAASSYAQQGGSHFFSSAASGSANDSATMVELLRATKSGGVTVNDGQDSNVNFIAKAGSSSNALQVDGSSGAVTINEASADADFRVESDNNANMLIVDAGNDRVGIGVTPVQTLHVQGASSANGAARRNAIFQDTGSAASGLGGGISFGGYYNGTSDFVYDFGTIQGIKENATANDYAGALRFSTRTNGYTPSERTRISSTGRLQHGADATDGNYTHLQGIRLKTNAVGAHTLDAALSIEGSGGDFYAQNWTGPTDVGFGLLFISSASTDYLLYQYRASGSSTNSLQIFANGNVTVHGALSKGSGSFKIDHPLPAKKDTHNLVHSFIEGPQADLIYRGSVDLVGGSATVNLDTAGKMTEGTFVLLNTNTQCFTTNESGWTAIKGSVSGNTLTITAQDDTCTDTISWMVVGERQDQHMKDTDWTDSDGKVIVEPEKT